MTGGFRKVAKALTKEIADNHYRSDLLPGETRLHPIRNTPPQRCLPPAAPTRGFLLRVAHSPLSRPPLSLLPLAATLAKWSLIHASQKKGNKKK